MSIARLMQMAAAGQAGDYQISRSLRFNSTDSAYLSRTPASAGNRKTWTWSGWVKRSKLGSRQFIFTTADSGGAYGFYFEFDDNDKLNFGDYSTPNYVWQKTTSSVYRDVSAWYSVVISYNTTESTASNRFKIFINGEQVTAFSTSSDPSLNYDGYINATTYPHALGRLGAVVNGLYFNGYMADVHFIDGQALTPSSFGETDETTGVWKPIAYAGTYGTNGFHLDFSDNTSTTTLGYDAAGSNDWTLNNFSVAAGAGNDSLVDSPTRYGTDTGAGGEVRGNYATLNAVSISTGFPYVAISNGNLGVAGTSAVNDGVVPATISAKTGKYYWEYTSAAYSAGGYSRIGIMPIEGVFGTNGYLGGFANSCGYDPTGTLVKTGGNTSSWGATWGANDVIGVALDCDNGAVYFSKNGVFQNSGVPTSGASKTGAAITWTGGSIEFYPICDMYQTTSSGNMNFGQRPFAYTAPSGFKALCTTNLPDPTVVQGDDYFNTVLYTGTGSSQSITGVGFQPDFVWIKERSGAADHGLYDAVRGVQQQLESNTTTDETTESTGLTAFGTDGFTVGALAQLNTSADTYVAWNWKESTTSKFDIVTYTGNGTARTISHNLGVVPNMIIVKARTTASTDQGWPVYHSANTAAPETDYLLLNSSAATADLDTVWNDTLPTSSVFSVGTNALVNANNDTYVAYLFANVAGYSAFGSYTGNGSADGPFVFTGFRPACIITKRTSDTDAWIIWDTARDPYNLTFHRLVPSESAAESTTTISATSLMDILSNGFKFRGSSDDVNGSGATYIYAAFAENPFKLSLAR